jgi:hypothetical protein
MVLLFSMRHREGSIFASAGLVECHSSLSTKEGNLTTTRDNWANGLSGNRKTTCVSRTARKNLLLFSWDLVI